MGTLIYNQRMEKDKILDEIKKYGFPEKEVAVSIETFFEGNNDTGSIGVNLYPQPSLEDFYSVFKKIKSYDKTESIFVRIAEDDEDAEWFYTDTVYIVGNYSIDEIKVMVKEIQPDEIYENWMYGKPVNIPETKNNVFSIWWD